MTSISLFNLNDGLERLRTFCNCNGGEPFNSGDFKLPYDELLGSLNSDIASLAFSLKSFLIGFCGMLLMTSSDYSYHKILFF